MRLWNFPITLYSEINFMICSIQKDYISAKEHYFDFAFSIFAKAFFASLRTQLFG